jgi:hypothetical protein
MEALQCKNKNGAAVQEAWIRAIICKNRAFKQKEQHISIIFETLWCEALENIFASFGKIRNKK